MQVCIYDAKVRKDEITLRWLGTAVANIYFYHRTVVKVKKNSAYDLTFTVYVPLCNNNNNKNKKNPPNIIINPLMYCSDTAYWHSID